VCNVILFITVLLRRVINITMEKSTRQYFFYIKNEEKIKNEKIFNISSFLLDEI